MIRAYLFALDPTDGQVQAFRSHCGAQRFAFNFGVEPAGKIRAQRAAEYSYGLRGADLTPCSAYDLRRAWNVAKHERAPWWKENSKEAYASGCANAATAFKNFGDSFRGARRGPKIRYPRFKSKHRARLTCRFTTGAFGLVRDRRHIRLPVIGTIRTHESTRRLARHVEAGIARIRSATLSFQRGRWHVAFSVELPDVEPAERAAGRIVGVDLGIKSLTVLSTGEIVPNNRRLNVAQKALRRAQRACARRRGPDRRTRIEPSQRWRKANARVSALHTRVANLRRNDTHQLTTRLVRDFDTLVIEDLHVAGMVRNRSLARYISDANWAEIRRQLTYKTERAGARLVVADRWFASSKTCSGCGAAKTTLMLSIRTYVCTNCGVVLDRDLNAAINLAQLVREQPDGTGVRRARLAGHAARSPREESHATQRHHREVVAR